MYYVDMFYCRLILLIWNGFVNTYIDDKKIATSLKYTKLILPTDYEYYFLYVIRDKK